MIDSTKKGMSVSVLLAVLIFIHRNDHKNILLYNAVVEKTARELPRYKWSRQGYISRIKIEIEKEERDRGKRRAEEGREENMDPSERGR